MTPTPLTATAPPSSPLPSPHRIVCTRGLIRRGIPERLPPELLLQLGLWSVEKCGRLCGGGLGWGACHLSACHLSCCSSLAFRHKGAAGCGVRPGVRGGIGQAADPRSLPSLTPTWPMSERKAMHPEITSSSATPKYHTCFFLF